MDPVHKADPELARAARRLVLPVTAVALLLAAALTAVSNRALVQPSPTLLYLLLAVLFVVGLAMLWPIRHLWAIGRDARAERRFPPAGARMLHDTRVYRGAAAQLRGGILQALAATLALFAVAVPLAVTWLVLDAT